LSRGNPSYSDRREKVNDHLVAGLIARENGGWIARDQAHAEEHQ
jgi:hypothetical protein